MPLQGQGTCSYSGFTFPTDRFTTLSIEAQPTPDSSGRAVKYITYTINVQTTIQNNNGTDEEMENIRRKLTSYAGELHYDQKGYGISSLAVNVPGGPIWDVDFGPKPQIVRWKPTGAAQACDVHWTCVAKVPECNQGGATYKNTIMEYCFTVAYSTDRSGYSKRVFSGHIIIPQTRSAPGVKSLQDTADSFYEKIVPALPDYFRRTSQERRLDESKNRLDFVFTDEEYPRVLPTDCIEAAASQTTRWNTKEGFAVSTLNATYEMSTNIGASDLYVSFLQMLKKRASRVFDLVVGGDFLVWDLTVTEPEIYGKNIITISATWQSFCTAKSLVGANGMFTKLGLENNDLVKWNNSEGNVARDPRGRAKQRFRPSDDIVVDLCQSPAPPPLPKQGVTPNLRSTPGLFLQEIAKQPNPQTSWLKFLMWLRFEVDDEEVLLKPLPDSPVRQQSQLSSDVTSSTLRTVDLGDLGTAPQGDGGFQGNIGGYLQSMPDHVVQYRAAPTTAVVLEGRAIRAGFPIGCPTIQSIGGVEAMPANHADMGSGFWTGLVGNALGIPIVAAEWSLRYLLPSLPGASGTPPSPIYSRRS